MGYRVQDLQVGDVVSVQGNRMNEDYHTVVGTVVRPPSLDNEHAQDAATIRTRSGALLCLHESADGTVVRVSRRRGTGRATVIRDGEINYRSRS